MTQERITIAGFIGLAALTIGLFGWLRADIGQIANRLDTQSERIAGVEVRIAAVEVRLGGVETRMDGIEARVAAVEAGIADIKAQTNLVPRLDAGQRALHERMARLEGTLSTVVAFADREPLGAN